MQVAIYTYFFQEVRSTYENWSEDDTLAIEFHADDDAIELDQPEQEVGSWKIVPLTLPSKVVTSSDDISMLGILLYIGNHGFNQRLPTWKKNSALFL